MVPTIILESSFLALFPDSYGIDTVDRGVGSRASRPVVIKVFATLQGVLVVASNKGLFDIMGLLRQCYEGSKGITGATGSSFRMLLPFARPLD